MEKRLRVLLLAVLTRLTRMELLHCILVHPVIYYCSPQTRDRALRANGRGSRMAPIFTLSTDLLRLTLGEQRVLCAKYGDVPRGAISTLRCTCVKNVMTMSGYSVGLSLCG